MSLMQGKLCSLSPDAWDIPRPGNFPDLGLLMEDQALAKTRRDLKEKLLNNPEQSKCYDHCTQEELVSRLGSDIDSLYELHPHVMSPWAAASLSSPTGAVVGAKFEPGPELLANRQRPFLLSGKTAKG